MKTVNTTKPIANLLNKIFEQCDPERIEEWVEWVDVKQDEMIARSKIKDVQNGMTDEEKKIWFKISRMDEDDLGELLKYLGSLADEKRELIEQEKRSALLDHLLKKYKPEDFKSDYKLKQMMQDLIPPDESKENLEAPEKTKSVSPSPKETEKLKTTGGVSKKPEGESKEASGKNSSADGQKTGA